MSKSQGASSLDREIAAARLAAGPAAGSGSAQKEKGTPRRSETFGESEIGTNFEVDDVVAVYTLIKKQSELTANDLKNDLASLNALIAENELFGAEVIGKVANLLFDGGIKSIATILTNEKKVISLLPKKITNDDENNVHIATKNIIELIRTTMKEIGNRRRTEKVKANEDREKSDSGTDDSDNDRSRGRTKKKKKNKKRRRTSSTSSSSSSSNRRARKTRAAERIIQEKGLVKFGLGTFPDFKLIREISKRKNEKFVSSKPIEDWIPSGLGSHLGRQQQKDLHNTRSKSASLMIAELIENVTTFWLTHMILGIVESDSILIHVNVLTNIANRDSQEQAVRYERKLIIYLREQLATKQIEKVDEYLIKERSEVMGDVKTSSSSFSGKRIDLRPGDPSRKGNQGNKGKGKQNQNQTQQIQRLEQQLKILIGMTNKGHGKGSGQSADRTPAPTPPRQSSVCRFYDQSTGKGCAKGSNCPFRHERSRAASNNVNWRRAEGSRGRNGRE